MFRRRHNRSIKTQGLGAQDINTRCYLKSGRSLSDRKIGLTAKSVQRQMGVDEPDFGMLWRGTEYRSGTKIPADTLIQPRIEGEIAFVLEREVTDPDTSMTDLIRSVAYALPAIEVVDSVSQMGISSSSTPSPTMPPPQDM